MNNITIENKEVTDVHIRIGFVDNKTYVRTFENSFINNLGSKDVYILADKNKTTEENYYSVTDFTKTGLTHYNITKIYSIGLGVSIVESIRENKEIVPNIVEQIMDWIGIPQSQKRNDWTFSIRSMIYNYVEHYDDFTPPNAFDKMFNVFQLCLKLGIIDMSNIAEFVSKEIFFALAETIRAQKLDDNRWKDPDSEDYDPLFGVPKSVKTIAFILDGLVEQPQVKLPVDHKFTVKDLENIQSFPELIYEATDQIVRWLKNFITQQIYSVSMKLEQTIQLYNAFTVGFINGIIELVASIVEAIGFMISLFQFEVQSELVESISTFINKLDWATIKIMIKSSIKEFFEYISSSDMYQKAYDFGVFIPQLLEIIIDAITISKGAAKVVKKMKDIADILLELLKDANKIIKDFEAQILLKLDRKTLKELREKGVTIDVELVYTGSSKPAYSGLPIKIPDGNKYHIRYKGVVLESFENEKDANKFLKKINKDESYLKDLFFEKALKPFTKLRKDLLNLDEVGLINLFKKELNVKHFKTKDLINFRDRMLRSYPRLKHHYNPLTGKTTSVNIAEFIINSKKKGKSIHKNHKVLSHSGYEQIYKEFVKTIDDNKFLENVKDLKGRSKRNDSEIKFVYEFLVNHIHRADEFVIETKNIYFACTSCQRELIMLKRYAESIGKKIEFKIFGDEDILGNKQLIDKTR
ncbi:hypothetical protein [Psychroserpens sp. MEBiC05023]